MKLYAVYDLVAEAIVGTMLMLYPNDGAAVRAFAGMIGNPKGLGATPGDYDLVCLGLCDTDSGLISPEAERRTVVTGLVLSQAKGSENGQA